MGLVHITAHLSSPIVLGGDDFEIDGLLVSAHPSTRAGPRGRESPPGRLPAIPLAHLDHAGQRTALGTIAILPASARQVQEHAVKRRDAEDLMQLARGINLGLGPGKNRLHRLAAIATPTVSWRAIGTPRSLLKLLRRHVALGRWTSSGYGVVSRWEARYLDEDPASVLVADGCAQRNLPASWTTWAESETTGALAAPYWHPARQTERIVRAGTPCALLPDVEDRVRAIADPAATRAHALRHALKRAARAIDAHRAG
jgi:hypothetical protein